MYMNSSFSRFVSTQIMQSLTIINLWCCIASLCTVSAAETHGLNHPISQKVNDET